MGTKPPSPSDPRAVHERGLTGVMHPDHFGPPVLRVRMTLPEWLGLGIRGITDRWSARAVPDGQCTHFLHQLAARARGIQAEQAQWVDATRTRMGIEVAAADAVLSRPLPSAQREATRPLATLTGRDRHEWAEEERDRVRGTCAAEADARSRTAASSRKQQLIAEMNGLDAYQAHLTETCRAYFEIRAARYTRARSGLFGFKLTPTPQVPSYPGLTNSLHHEVDFSGESLALFPSGRITQLRSR